MAPGIGASGFLGVAVEAIPNTYVAPSKFIPIQNESLAFVQETQWRRPLRQTASIVGAVEGDVRVEGDVSMEAFPEILPLLLQAARTSVVKVAGVSPAPSTYTFKPTDAATAAKTLSITTVRNGQVFAYKGCVLGSFTFTVDAARLMFNFTVLGSDEATAAMPVPTWQDMAVFGAGSYNIQIPTASQVFDADGFDFSVENNAEAQYRLKDTGRGAQFIKYGENNVTASMERDFDSRAEYETFKALTASSLTMKATKGDQSVAMTMPVAIKDEYTVGLSGQGDLIRAATSYTGIVDATGFPYSLEVVTTENYAVV